VKCLFSVNAKELSRNYNLVTADESGITADLSASETTHGSALLRVVFPTPASLKTRLNN
jgi:hypothetical protein